MAWLRKGQHLHSDESRYHYRVATDRLHQGGFGEVYRGFLIDEHEDDRTEVAIKVSDDALSWHGEAFFGRLLGGRDHVVPLYDAFVVAGKRGGPVLMKYLLVMPWFASGTVADHLGGAPPWPESQVEEEVRGLLDVLALLHRRGICHGDITPNNVFVDRGHLLLGDLGIAGLSLDDGPLELRGAAPVAYQPPDLEWRTWSPSADVFQLGLLALSLLSGFDQAAWDISGRTLRALAASDKMKGWIREACGPSSKQFMDADDAAMALDDVPVKPARAPRTLKSQYVVLTGTLSVPRTDARRLVTAAGATYQTEVSGTTTLVVKGKPNPRQIGKGHGTKLYEAERRIRLGQPISIIDADRFMRLTTATSSHRSPVAGEVPGGGPCRPGATPCF